MNKHDAIANSSFFAQSLAMMCIANFEGYFIHVNSAFEQTLGFTHAELCAVPFIDFVHPEDKERTRQELERIAAGGQSINWENRYRCKDGAYRWFNWTASPAGDIIYGIAQDVTARKATEEELKTRIQLEQLITQFSSQFINIAVDNIEQEIYQALQRIGEFMQADRSGIATLSEKFDMFKIDYEWCAPRIQTTLDHWKQGIVDDYPIIYEKLKRLECCYIASLDTLPPEEKHLKAQMVRFHIQSVMLVPLAFSGELVGIFYFDAVREKRTWPKSFHSVMRTVGDIFVNALERKRAEEKLRRREDHLQRIFNTSNDAILLIDTQQSKINDANRRACEMLEYSYESLLATPVQQIHGDETTRFLDFANQVISRKDGRAEEFTLFTQTGVALICEISASVYERIDDGDPLLLVNTRDITQRKQAEAKWQSLVENAPDYIMIVERDSTVLFINRPIQSIKPEQLVGHKIHEFLIPEHQAATDSHLNMVFDTGESATYDAAGLDLHGELHWYRNHVGLLEYQGQTTALAISRDITKQKQAEEDLRASEARFRTIFEQGPLGICLWDVETDLFILANKTLCTLLGYEVPELTTLTLQGITFPQDIEATNQLIHQLQYGKISSGMLEKRYIRKNGTVVWVAETVSLVRDDKNTPLFGIGMTEDITERKAADVKLKRYNARLETLHEIDNAILTTNSSEAIARTALEHIRRLVTCQRVSVVLFDWETHMARIFAVDGEGAQGLYEGQELSIDQLSRQPSSYSWVDNSTPRLVYRIDDLTELIPTDTIAQYLLAAGIRSQVTVQLVAGEERVGLLNIGASLPEAFSEDDIEIVREVADQLAIALQHTRLYHENEESRERLRILSQQLVAVQEAERRNLAYELHDEIGQLLTGLKITLEMSKRQSYSAQQDAIEQSYNLTSELLTKVRELSLNLRPAMLDDLGLLPTLLWHFERYLTQTSVRVSFSHNGLDRRFQPAIETAAYRIIQEALTNVARHAQVPSVSVRTWADDDLLSIEISDDGTGFDQESGNVEGTNIGLLGMQERAASLGGQLQVISAPSAGTRLLAMIPVTSG